MADSADVSSTYYSYVIRPGYAWSQRALTIILECLLLLITVTYIIRYRHYLKTMKESMPRHCVIPPMELQIRKWRVATHAFTILTICLYCLHGLHSALNAWSIYARLDLNCTYYHRSRALLYHWSKFSLYTVMALRIKVVFHDSAFHVPINRILYAMYALLLLFLLVATAHDVFSGVPNINLAIRTHSDYCLVGDADVWSIAVFICADTVMSLLCLLLFNIPLRTLIKSCGIEDDEIMELIKKYTILTCTAIVSTAAFSVLSVVLRMAWLMTVDTIINALCLLFMSSFYAHYYSILCPCCVRQHKAKVRKKHTMMVRGGGDDDDGDGDKNHGGNAFENKAAQWTASAFGSGFSEENNAQLAALSPPMEVANGEELDTVPEMMIPAQNAELRNRLESVDDVVNHFRGSYGGGNQPRPSQSMRSQKHSQSSRKETDEISMTVSRTRDYSATKSRTAVSAMAALRLMDRDEKRQSAKHVLHNLRDHLHMGTTGTLKAIVTGSNAGNEPSEQIPSKQMALELELNVTKEHQGLMMATNRTETHSITAVVDAQDSDDDEENNNNVGGRPKKYSDTLDAYGNRLSVLDTQKITVKDGDPTNDRKSVSLSVSQAL